MGSILFRSAYGRQWIKVSLSGINIHVSPPTPKINKHILMSSGEDLKNQQQQKNVYLCITYNNLKTP